MTRAKKLEISWDSLKGKILTTKKAKKVSQDEKERREVLVNICFNKKVVQMLIVDLGIYI